MMHGLYELREVTLLLGSKTDDHSVKLCAFLKWLFLLPEQYFINCNCIYDVENVLGQHLNLYKVIEKSLSILSGLKWSPFSSV